MLRKVLILLVLCWPMLAQDSQEDPCGVSGPQDWEVVFSQEATPALVSQNMVPVVDYDSMITAAQQQQYVSEEQRERTIFALRAIAGTYPQHNWQPFQVFKIGMHRNPDCKLVALEAVPFDPPPPATNPVEQQVAAKVAEVIPQVIGAEFRRQQEAQMEQQVAAPMQQSSSPRPSKLSRGMQIGQGALLGFTVNPLLGIASVAKPAIEMVASLLAPGDDPTVRTLSAKGISPGPSGSVNLKKDWYKNPDW